MVSLPVSNGRSRKKSVAIGIAGVTVVVVAAWRQVQRDNTLATDAGRASGARPAPGGQKTMRLVISVLARAAPRRPFTPSKVSASSTKAELLRGRNAELGIEAARR